MNAIHEKLTALKHKQNEITELYNQTMPQKNALEKEFHNKSEALKTEYQGKINEVMKPLDHAREKYKAELKAFAGVTDGEAINVLDVVDMVIRFAGAIK